MRPLLSTSGEKASGVAGASFATTVLKLALQRGLTQGKRDLVALRPRAPSIIAIVLFRLESLGVGFSPNGRMSLLWLFSKKWVSRMKVRPFLGGFRTGTPSSKSLLARSARCLATSSLFDIDRGFVNSADRIDPLYFKTPLLPSLRSPAGGATSI